MEKLTAMISVLLSVFLLFACAPVVNTDTETTKKEIDTEKTSETTKKPKLTEPSETDTESLAPLSLPIDDNGMTLAFSSGGGSWATTLLLYPDGTFEGSYHDSNMGEMGEGYPKGSIYICDFSGRFEVTEKLNEYAYKLKLTELKTEKEKDEEWIEDEIRYISSHPYGITAWSSDSATGEKFLIQGEDFVFYLADTPLEGLNENFLTWWPYRIQCYVDKKEITTLQCCAILNVTTEFGFFDTGDLE